VACNRHPRAALSDPDRRSRDACFELTHFHHMRRAAGRDDLAGKFGTVNDVAAASLPRIDRAQRYFLKTFLLQMRGRISPAGKIFAL
jgi:hypothetical protein